MASAELYDPAIGSWTATGSLNIARFGHRAALLPNGIVLVEGGLDINQTIISSAELYEVATPTPTPTPTPGPITLSASGRKVGGINTVRLTWNGATSTNIDVYRNSMPIARTADDGSYVDSTGDTGRARYRYRVCEAGTQTCSNIATVTFRQ
jgi:hypothetical protein